LAFAVLGPRILDSSPDYAATVYDGEVTVAGESYRCILSPVRHIAVSVSGEKSKSHGLLPCRSLMCRSDTAVPFDEGEATDP
jgi:hypothetical protein